MRMPYAALERYEEALETIAKRVKRAASALEKHGVSYAVVGGNAVAAWVSRVDPEAVRGTRDVDIAIRRRDLDRATEAMAEAGFRFREVLGIAMFVDAVKPTVKGGVHLVFSEEKVRPEYAHAVPLIPESPPRSLENYAVIPLESLVAMKLTSYRDKDRTHVRDMLEVGLITPEIEQTLPPDLMARLQELKDTPNG
jgi:hypothetical protein